MTTLDTLIDYKQLVEALADAVVFADPSGAIRFWNPAAEHLFGFTKAEALGNSLDLVVSRAISMLAGKRHSGHSAGKSAFRASDSSQ